MRGPSVFTEMLLPTRDFSAYCAAEWKKGWKQEGLWHSQPRILEHTNKQRAYILHILCMSLLGHFFHAWIIHYVSKVLICFAAHTKLSISSHKLRTQGIIPSKYVSHVITERGFSLSGYDT